MPFSLGQIFGGWRKKESKAQKSRGKASENSLTPPQRGRDRKGAGVRNELRPHLEFSSASPRDLEKISEPVRAVNKSKSEAAWRTIISPHISEKGGMMGEGKYVFKVTSGANGQGIKRAIEERYGVEIASVRTINMPHKPTRHRQVLGERSGFKKAIIELKEGQSISEF